MKSGLLSLGASIAIGITGCNNAPDAKNITEHAPKMASASEPIVKVTLETCTKMHEICNTTDTKGSLVKEEELHHADFEYLVNKIETTKPQEVIAMQKKLDGVNPDYGIVNTEAVIRSGKFQYTIWTVDWKEKSAQERKCGTEREIRVYYRRLWTKPLVNSEYPDPNLWGFSICENGKLLRYSPFDQIKFGRGRYDHKSLVNEKEWISQKEAWRQIEPHLYNIQAAYK